MDGKLREYYARRAPFYDEIYRKPERQDDLERLRRLVREALTGRSVLEIACGTGYWTEVVAPVAERIVATDVDPGLLQRAAERVGTPPHITFAMADAYHPDVPEVGPFTAGLGAFWWSHVPVTRLPAFLAGFHRRLAPGAQVVFVDNRYVEGSSTGIARTDADGNTYQRRRLETGDTFEIIKNFPDPSELRRMILEGCGEPRIVQLDYFWFCSYRLSAGER